LTLSESVDLHAVQELPVYEGTDIPHSYDGTDLRVSHMLPLNPVVHVQEKLSAVRAHVPPFKHGSLKQASGAETYHMQSLKNI